MTNFTTVICLATVFCVFRSFHLLRKLRSCSTAFLSRAPPTLIIRARRVHACQGDDGLRGALQFPDPPDPCFLRESLPFFSKALDLYRGRRRHINIWHINDFSVTPVTDPPGRVPWTKMFMFLGFRTQHINFWPVATGRETPGHPLGRPPPHPGSHWNNLFMFMCLFLSWL